MMPPVLLAVVANGTWLFTALSAVVIFVSFNSRIVQPRRSVLDCFVLKFSSYLCIYRVFQTTSTFVTTYRDFVLNFALMLVHA